MKILLVSTLDSTHTVRWANGLRERGHDVVIFSTRHPLPGLSTDAKIVVRNRFGKLGYLIHGVALRRTIKRERPDIVHAHFASGYGLLCSAWLKKYSYILSMWGSDIFDFPKDLIRRWILVRNLTRAGMLLSTSRCMVEEARKYTNRSIYLTPFGVNVEEFRSLPPAHGSDKVFRIGTARRLEHKYGIDILVEAFARFRNNYPGCNVELCVAGEGSERSRIEALAADLGVLDAVRFLGWLPHDQMPSFLNGLDVFCVPSRYRSESFGVAVLEASACGVPVIASNTGGLPETVRHGKTGFLVRPESLNEMSELLGTLFSDEDLRSRLGRAGRAFVVQRYSWEKSLDIMERTHGAFLTGLEEGTRR